MPAVRKRVDSRVGELPRWVGGRQHRRREVNGHRHNVRADDLLLHRPGVEVFPAAAARLAERNQPTVSGGEERAGAAGEVPDFELPRGGFAFAVGEGERGEHSGGGRRRVEGGEELPVGDEALKDDAGEVVRAGHALVYQSRGGGGEQLEHVGRQPLRQLRHNLMRDVEDGVIVDAEDIAPLVEDGHFGEPPAGAPQSVEVLDAVGAREVRVKDERVGDDGHRHAARLDAVLLMDALGYPRADVGAEFYRFAQPLRCGADALLEAVGGVLDGAQGDARLIGEAREVRRAADEPSRVWEPVVLVARRSGEQRVLEAGVGLAERVAERLALEVAEPEGDADGDGGEDERAVGERGAKPVAGVVLDRRGGGDLRLDDDGRGRGRGDEDVGLAARALQPP